MTSTEPSQGTPGLSLVIPCYDEEDNLRPLVTEIHKAVEPLGMHYEIILVDDGSRDKSWETLKDLGRADARVRAQRLETNTGQSAALWAGMRAAHGKIIATLDADLQNDPQDLPRLLEALGRFDCACGNRVAARRQGDNLVRRASSRIANWVRNWLSGDDIEDSGCCFRAFKRECIADLKFFKGMHRFLPTLIKIEGFSVVEIPVRQNPRHAGRSHYGVWNRLFASFYDLIAVRWMKKRMIRFRVVERVN
jgi:dolichol-phosphate mannosyltransferase